MALLVLAGNKDTTQEGKTVEYWQLMGQVKKEFLCRTHIRAPSKTESIVYSEGEGEREGKRGWFIIGIGWHTFGGQEVQQWIHLPSASWRTRKASVPFGPGPKAWEPGVQMSEGKRRCPQAKEQIPSSFSLLFYLCCHWIEWSSPTLVRVVLT